VRNANEFRAEFERRRDVYGLLHPSVVDLRDQIMETLQLPTLTDEQRAELVLVVKQIDEEKNGIYD
jgi:hypothetical protein